MSAKAVLRAWVVVYLKGVCMGAADSVPGVSGGTIALIAGVYERLIGAITAINATRVRQFVSGFVPGSRHSAYAAFLEMDGVFLVVLGSGIITAVVTITRVLAVAIETLPVPTFGFFFGLIAASAVVLYSEVSLATRGRQVAAVAGFVLAFVVSGSAAASLGSGLVVTLVAGAIAVSAMILPGISGSLLLIILGQYEHMVGSLKAFVDALLGLVTGGSTTAVVEPGTTVAVFVAGAVVGLFTISHAVRRALEHYREATLAFLVSLIVGALRAPVVRVDDAVGQWTTEVVAVFVAAALVGGVLVVLLDRYAGVIDG